MQSARLFARRLVNVQARRNYQSKHHRELTMNDMPVPKGDFYELEAQRNKKYNMVLALGIVVAGSSLVLAKTSGLINLHLSPPESID